MDLCDTRRLPTVGDLNTQFPIGRFWRFQVTTRGRGQAHVTRDTCPAQVLADPTVSMFGSRDIDSYLTAREAAAVSAWRVSGKQWHVMRDGPFHRSTVLAGLWGGANYENMTEAARVKQLLTGVQPNTYKFYDQRILHGRVWPVIRDRAAIYDSYNCGMVWKFGHCRAWPTRRYAPAAVVACSLLSWCVVAGRVSTTWVTAPPRTTRCGRCGGSAAPWPAGPRRTGTGSTADTDQPRHSTLIMGGNGSHSRMFLRSGS